MEKVSYFKTDMFFYAVSGKNVLRFSKGPFKNGIDIERFEANDDQLGLICRLSFEVKESEFVTAFEKLGGLAPFLPNLFF